MNHTRPVSGAGHLHAFVEGASGSNDPPVVVILEGGPGKPLAANDGRLLGMIHPAADLQRIRRVEGDEGVPAAHSDHLHAVCTCETNAWAAENLLS